MVVMYDVIAAAAMVVVDSDMIASADGTAPAVEWSSHQVEMLGETGAPLHCDSRTFTLISKLEEILQSRTTYSTCSHRRECG